MIRAALRTLRAMPAALEVLYLRWAAKEMGALHPDLPYVVHRINELERR